MIKQDNIESLVAEELFGLGVCHCLWHCGEKKGKKRKLF